MTAPAHQVRRATIDDLPQLIALWKEERLPWETLERRFQEFQIAVSPEGEVLGAVGLQIAGREGLLHSEAFAYPEHADALRDLIWSRMQVVARNHGLLRVWTQLQTPFWHLNGFVQAPAELLDKLPPGFSALPGTWYYAQLREEVTAPAAVIERELALFQAMERENTERILRRARTLKILAIVFALGLLVPLLIWALITVLRLRSG